MKMAFGCVGCEHLWWGDPSLPGFYRACPKCNKPLPQLPGSKRSQGMPSQIGTSGLAVIDLLKRGATLGAAARACGITYNTVCAWRRKGATDIAAVVSAGYDPNTYDQLSAFGRFTLECDKALGEAQFSCEERVHQNDPKFYLTNGPGRRSKNNPDGWVANGLIKGDFSDDDLKTEYDMSKLTDDEVALLQGLLEKAAV